MNKERLVELARDLYKNPHPLFGFEHGLHVMENAQMIAELVNGDGINKRVAYSAALLHDVAFTDNTSLTTHALDSPRIIVPALTYFGEFTDEEIALIAQATSRHSEHSWDTVGKPQSIEEKLVYDADQIEWINARSIIKFHEIARNIGKPYIEFAEWLPERLAQRYNNIFLRETRKSVNENWLKVMASLGRDPKEYVGVPEAFCVDKIRLPNSQTIRRYVSNLSPVECILVGLENDNVQVKCCPPEKEALESEKTSLYLINPATQYDINRLLGNQKPMDKQDVFINLVLEDVRGDDKQ